MTSEEGKSLRYHFPFNKLRWKNIEPLPLTIYRNGIFLMKGPFRPFGNPTTEQFINDILDGYFPYELKEKYPEGGIAFSEIKTHFSSFQPCR